MASHSCSRGETEDILSQPGNINDWAKGQWSEYEVHKGEKQFTIRYTVIARDEFDTSLFWIESVVNTGEDSFLWQALVPEFFKGSPKELVIVDLTQSKLEALAVPLGKNCRTDFLLGSFDPSNLKRLGFETDFISTPAGKFYSLHCQLMIEDKPASAWISSKAPIFGLVQWESQNEVRTLVNFGYDGKSILPKDIVRMQIGPADFSKPVFRENLVTFVIDTSAAIIESIP
ncbi:hypothetical protein JXA84_05485 [candidate division WOR-3 bacterium]|nr:hypothetical protein [candidate division WOR-3 bacterium]